MYKLRGLLSVAVVLAASSVSMVPTYAATVQPNQGAQNPNFVQKVGKLQPFVCQGNGEVSAGVVTVNDPVTNKNTLFIDASTSASENNRDFSNASGGNWSPINLTLDSNATVSFYWRSTGVTDLGSLGLQVDGNDSNGNFNLSSIHASQFTTTTANGWNFSTIPESLINDEGVTLFGNPLATVTSLSVNVLESPQGTASYEFGDLVFTQHAGQNTQKKYQPTVNTTPFTPCPVASLTQEQP